MEEAFKRRRAIDSVRVDLKRITRTRTGIQPTDSCLWNTRDKIVLDHLFRSCIDPLVSKDKNGNWINANNVHSVVYTLAWHYQQFHPTKKIMVFTQSSNIGDGRVYLDLTSDSFANDEAYTYQNTVPDSDIIAACKCPNTVVFIQRNLGQINSWLVYVHDTTPYESWRRFMHPNDELIILYLLFAQHKGTLALPEALMRSLCGMLLDAERLTSEKAAGSLAIVERSIRKTNPDGLPQW